MAMRIEVRLAPRSPAQRQVERRASPGIIRRILSTLIERHGNVGAKRNLDIHRMLRRKEVRPAIQMRPKLHPVLGHLAQFIEAEDLKAARVSQNGAIPAHKPVQPAKPANQLMPRPQIKMIRIAQNDPRPQLFEQMLRNSLDRSHRPHRHEDRRLHRRMRQRHRGAASVATRCMDLKRKRHFR